MNELNKITLDVSIDTSKYNLIEIEGVEYFRSDWMIFKMIEYAKSKLEQQDKVNKDKLPTEQDCMTVGRERTDKLPSEYNKLSYELGFHQAYNWMLSQIYKK